MKSLLILFSLFFSIAASALPIVAIEYKPTSFGLTYKRERMGFVFDQFKKIIIVSYNEWADDGSGNIIIPKIRKRYKLTGSYYYELSLAKSGTSTINNFLDTAVDLRLGAYVGDVQAGIEAGRATKDVQMTAFGWTP